MKSKSSNLIDSFGVFSSPYLAICTIQKLADDECRMYLTAAEQLIKYLYVDLFTRTNIDKARALRDKIIALLSRSEFNIRQWASNDRRIIDDLNPDALNVNVLDKNNSLKTLGTSWCTKDDVLRFSVHPINRSQTQKRSQNVWWYRKSLRFSTH